MADVVSVDPRTGEAGEVVAVETTTGPVSVVTARARPAFGSVR